MLTILYDWLFWPTVAFATAVVIFGSLFLIGEIRERRRQRRQKEERRPEGKVRKVGGNEIAADPTRIRCGDDIYLDGTFLEYGTVVMTAHYEDAEDADDDWYEFEIRGEDGKSFFLSVEQDDDDRWIWSKHRELSRVQAEAIDGFATMDDENWKPPRVIQGFEGSNWRLAPDCYNYKVKVVDIRADRETPSQYAMRVTDYVERDGHRECSVEVWKGGRSVTVGSRFTGAVRMIANG